MTAFQDLGLSEPLWRAAAAEGYTAPTPIQAGAIPILLQGKDLLGIAQTGTGKTGAFVLPMMQRLSEDKRRAGPGQMRALILAPTRELASQIQESCAKLGASLPLRHTVIFGGVNQRSQVQALQRGIDIVVATPGRLLDLMHQGHVRLDAVEIFVLDEADRMFDMGFVNDIRKLAAKIPPKRQTLLFSATMPDAVASLATSVLGKHERIEIAPQSTTVERIEQRVMFVKSEHKRPLLAELLGKDTKDGPPDARGGVKRAIVFTRTKHGADRIVEYLSKQGVEAQAIHGNKSQNQRERALSAFREGRIGALIATDIAARGIDIDDITHVINFDLPNEPESYVHRIGRTARAGRAGVAYSLCDTADIPNLRGIEKTIQRAVPVEDDHAFHCAETHERHGSGAHIPKVKQAQRGGRPNGRDGGRSEGGRGEAGRAEGGRGEGGAGGGARTGGRGGRNAAPAGAAPGAANSSRGPRPAAAAAGKGPSGAPRGPGGPKGPGGGPRGGAPRSGEQRPGGARPGGQRSGGGGRGGPKGV